MHILWMSDSPSAPSGFGNVTRFVCGGLANLGHRVSILGWQNRGTPATWNGCQLYPLGYSETGADVLLFYLQRLRPDVLIILADILLVSWIIHPLISNTGIPRWLYYPLGSECSNGRLPESWVQILRQVELPITISRYGLDVTTKNGVTAAYIPHGVDTGLFRPPASKTEAKAAFGYQERFVILSDARNQWRKLLPRTLEIFRRFAKGRPDVLLHLHCDPNDPVARSPRYCYDLQADIDFLAPDGSVRITPGMSLESGGIPIEDLAQLYQAADIHLLASSSEGFGIPTLQAAAAGVVPIAVDYSANRELVLDHGEAVPARHLLSSEFGIRAALIDIDETVARLETLYADRATLERKSAAAVRFAAAYDWRNIIPQWDNLLSRKVGRVQPETPANAATKVGRAAQSEAGQLPFDQHDTPALFADIENYLAGLASTRELVSQIKQDHAQNPYPLTIPITPPPANPALVPHRSSGYVFIGGPNDVPVVRQLAKIFPGLNVWAATPVVLGSTETGDAKPISVWQPGTDIFRQQLAASVLAIDLGGRVPALASEAAELSVPCIGLTSSTEQARLWPELTLRTIDVGAATMLGRWMLTDQGEVGALCATARRVLSDQRVNSNIS